MIEAMAGAVTVAAACGYVIARYRYRCSHKWKDDTWLDEGWELEARTEDPDGHDIHPQYRLRRGMQQECKRCGSTRTNMRTVVMWDAHRSDDLHSVLRSAGNFS